MSVVLRCPSCGTTQPAGGACEACHQADVRWFCTGHDPGRWLEAPTCPTCEALREAAMQPERPPVEAPHRTAPRAAAVETLGRPREPMWLQAFRAILLARTLVPAGAPARTASMLGRVRGCLLRSLLVVALVLAGVGYALYLLARNVLPT